jgi:hypothetical protein
MMFKPSDLTEALATVQAISEQLDMPMLETLMYIREHTEEFSMMELSHYYRVMADFQRLLAPKQEETDPMDEFNYVGSKHHY